MLTRNPNVLKCPTFTPMPKSPAELAELDLSAAAKAVPDASIEDNPSYVAAKAQADAWEVRLTRLIAHPGKHLIADRVEAIANELAEAKIEYRFACLDSFLDGDRDFAAAIEVAERIALLERRLHAAKTASVDLNRRGSELNELKDFRDRAEANLQTIRFELKRQAVLAQQVAAV